jgi:hypothetical protein
MVSGAIAADVGGGAGSGLPAGAAAAATSERPPPRPAGAAIFHPCPRDPGCPYCCDTAGPRAADWSFLDGVYCISLQSREDRAREATRELHRAGLCRRTLFYRPLKHPTRPVAGIWESHRAVAMHARARGHERVLILEDDVLLPRRVDERTTLRIARALASLPPGWTIFFLGHMTRWAYPVGRNVIRVSATAAHAYVASRRLLDWLAEHPYGTPGVRRVKLVGKGLDSAYALLPGTYALFPMIAVQGPSPSDHFADGASKTEIRKLKHLFSHSRHRERLLWLAMRPMQILMVALSPVTLLWLGVDALARRMRRS